MSARTNTTTTTRQQGGSSSTPQQRPPSQGQGNNPPPSRNGKTATTAGTAAVAVAAPGRPGGTSQGAARDSPGAWSKFVDRVSGAEKRNAKRNRDNVAAIHRRMKENEQREMFKDMDKQIRSRQEDREKMMAQAARMTEDLYSAPRNGRD